MSHNKLYFILLTMLVLMLFVTGCSGGKIPVDPNDDDPQPEPNDPPEAIFSVSPNMRAYDQFQNVHFDASESSDPDNEIIAYEWDFEYDDSTFNIQKVGPSLDYTLPSFGSVIAAVRVVDSGKPALSSIYRSRMNVRPSGELSNVTQGQVDNIVFREITESNGDFYVLYTGEINSEMGAWVQRSSDAGASWGDPVRVSDLPEDLGPWGIWLDSAPFGIALGWISTNGFLKYTYGEPKGIDSIEFAPPQSLNNVGTSRPEPVLYSVAATDDGKYAYLCYMSVGSYEVRLVVLELDSGEVANSENIVVAVDNADRFNITGASVAAAPDGRAYVVHIWKSLGYDNLDEVRLYYLDPPGFAVNGPVRVDHGLDGFIYNHDPYVIANNNNEPLVVFRTTGIYGGGRDIALAIGEGNPPVFRETIRANNTLNGDPKAAQNSPTVAYDREHGHLWVGFEDFRYDSKLSQIYLTMFDDQYSTLLPDFDISGPEAYIYSEINPRIGFRSGAEPALVVAWERNGVDIVAYHASY